MIDDIVKAKTKTFLEQLEIAKKVLEYYEDHESNSYKDVCGKTEEYPVDKIPIWVRDRGQTARKALTRIEQLEKERK